MKNLLHVLTALCFSCLILSSKANDGITVIKGHVTKENVRNIILFEVIEGQKTEYASTRLDVNNDFAFALKAVKDGFYYLSDQNKKMFTRIYLKSGEQLEIQLTENGYDFVKGSKENKLLHDWFTTSYIITNPAFNWMKDTSTYISFFPKIEAFVPQVPVFKTKIKTNNKRFNELLNLAVDMDVEHAAMYFVLTPNSKHPQLEDYPAFYNTIVQPRKYSSASILQLGEGVEILGRYPTFAYRFEKEKLTRENMHNWSVNLFGNDTIKGAYLSNNLSRYKSYEELEFAINPYRKYLVTDTMQAHYFRALKAVSSFKKGSAAYNFSYPNLDAKNVSMNDLKGKVILVDVWATWCGPCKAEIPHLKKLEEEFRGKNVEFVSISVDVEKDKEKWKEMVMKEQLGGTQLFAGGWSEITKFYDITGIPRFMVFDQQGKIVSANSPRPSNPELKELLLKTLEEKPQPANAGLSK